MAKYYFSLLVMMIISAASFGQTAKPKFEQLKNDPKTTENAAKADARLINKKNIVDSAIIKPAAVKRKKQVRQSKRKRINLSGIKNPYRMERGRI
jgi:hypothetical protein